MRRVAGVVAIVSLASCSTPADRAAVVPVAATPSVARGGGLAPGSCAEARFLPVNKPGVVPVVLGTEIGGSFRRGLNTYRIEEASVAVLRPDAVLDVPPGEPDPILARQNEPVREVAIRDLPEGDHPLLLVFDGKDAAGAPLPAGRYPVVFSVRTHPAGQCVGHGTPWLSYGLLTTLDWRG